jgi:hypothetical protein
MGGDSYDWEVVWLAAHLHDWGAYKPWAEAGRDNLAASVRVAASFLAEEACDDEVKTKVLESAAPSITPPRESRV